MLVSLTSIASDPLGEQARRRLAVARRSSKTEPERKADDAYHHGHLRTALLQAALETIAARGVDAVKMNELARLTGVSVAAPFRHFPNRQALLVALAEDAAQRLQARMEAAARSHEDPTEAHRARGVAYVRFAVEEPAYFAVLSRAEVIAASPVLQRMSAMNIEAMDLILGKRRGGDATPTLVRRTAGVLAAQALTFGLARMIVEGLLGDITAEQAERLAHEVTGVLGEGL
ncbi:TetR/AcrR family transcriptional regulator [Corallococcus sicarius]|uniref:TetR/AcrR family transcriptional regulator n=1 Tax=Corallococcus sicarius TaxID=2316726 RepID=A0A3A8NPI7_9BACT|nr:TetR/AcrR family transcriptional regulator [Corallococcus sicarius]